MNNEKKLAMAGDPEGESPFDYIIVGSGAGGGPLAARLAQGGKTVLLLEAGEDPAIQKSVEFPDAEPGEVNQVPGYYAAASEDGEISWQFSIRHYEDKATQQKDEKYNQLNESFPDPNDPSRPAVSYPRDTRFLDPAPNGRKGGVMYPRTAALGGCTAHHAMIIIAPNDRDWNYIADLTGDESWRAERMRGYFAKMERCLYRKRYQRWLGSLLGPITRLWQIIVRILDPKASLENGGHGTGGWQPTSFLDPKLIEQIAKSDRPFIKLLVGTVLKVIYGGLTPVRFIKQTLLRFRADELLDPNDLNTRRNKPEGVFLIPMGIESGDGKDENGRFLLGRRAGVRELLLKTEKSHPDNLVIEKGVHVTRVLFDKGKDGVPIAVGVEYARGKHLYEASPLRRDGESEETERKTFFCRSEVILCGGAFNTPQLLMLSGIGDTGHFDEVDERIRETDESSPTLGGLTGRDLKPLKKKDNFVHLSGVGRNLQDRYEVTVVSEIADDFETLKDVSFNPGDPNDPARREWLQNKGGLYRTNGGTLAILRTSPAAEEAGLREPDLFTFGAPAAFRGYYWGWSREVFKPGLGAQLDQKNLWSWIILKAYTSNGGGTVRLWNADPFDQPQIIFDSFNEAARKRWNDEDDRSQKTRNELEDSARDLGALVDAVSYLRKINACNPETFVREIQPGSEKPDDSDELQEWIRTQAWGHHASCTCRIGADDWRDDTGDLNDEGAVLDSRFRVHGVRRLRVVDASVFPRIPGYFIVTPIFMISEKAADTILADATSEVFPAGFRNREAAAIRERRRIARSRLSPEKAETGGSEIPDDSVGVALSGGGIRSATFALGLLQSLAGRNRIRDIDFLSTVSGGGFTGSFLGRLFTRPSVTSPPPDSLEPADPSGQVQEVLKNTSSGPLWWLRSNANYILGAGGEDVRQNLAVFWRNLLTVHLVVAALLFSIFGLAALLTPFLPEANLDLPARSVIECLPGDIPSEPPAWLNCIILSNWWWFPAAIFVLALLPLTLGYWLAPKSNSYRPYPTFALLGWLVLITGGVCLLFLPHGRPIWVSVIVLALAWLAQELARGGSDPPSVQPRKDAEDPKVLPLNGFRGPIVRNRLTRALGTVLMLFALALLWFVIDTAARSVAAVGAAAIVGLILVALGPFLPRLQSFVLGGIRGDSKEKNNRASMETKAKLIGIPLALFLLFALDVAAHSLASISPEWCLITVLLAAVFSLAIGRGFEFLNRSSLHKAYGARLTRTFQGASNEKRVYGTESNPERNVQLADPEDDIPLHKYHPEKHGGPIHFINVCVNDTVDFASDREVRDRKALPMCVGPHGVSVGHRYFASWTRPDNWPRWQKIRRFVEGMDADDHLPTALRAVPLPENPNAFHVLKSTASDSAEVEPLSLGSWTAISGAAFSTGVGRRTSLPFSILMGLANVRLGYWWDSGIRAGERPGRYPLGLWRFLKRLPIELFRMQSLLLSEWQGRFHGASRWFWYLSDGGHFEVTGLYELLRRRVPFMILSDAGADPQYRYDDLGRLSQQARIDFGAQIQWVRPDRPDGGETGWDPIESAAAAMEDPNLEKNSKKMKPTSLVREWIDPDKLGSIYEIKNDPAEEGHHAALARVSYDGSRDVSWLLIVKPSVSRAITQDVKNYAIQNPKFPQQPTSDQFFDDAQWESYRSLGQQIGTDLFLDVNEQK